MKKRELLIGTAIVLVAVVSAVVVGTGLAGSVNTAQMQPAVPNDANPSDTSGGGNSSPAETTTAPSNSNEGGDGTTTPNDANEGNSTDGETTTASGTSAESMKMLVEVSQPSKGVGDNESAKLTITLRSADGEPVEGKELKLQSVGVTGEFKPGTTVETNGEGKATVKWFYYQPTKAEDYAKMPPSEQTSIAVQTTGDGKVSKFVTVKLNIDPYMEGCHSEGEDL
jgi:hypothetical protein